MIYTWYYIFNLDEFNSTGLVSKNYTVVLDQIGQREILVTKGNLTGILYEEEFLPISLNDKNPFEFELKAVYVDDSNQVWLGLNGRLADS
jgi:hypothetical protein